MDEQRGFRETTTSLRGETLQIVAKPGISGAEGPTPATMLLAASVTLPPDGRALVIGGGPGTLAAALARQTTAGTIWVADVDYLTLTSAEQTIVANGVRNAHVLFDPVTLPPEIASCHAVVLEPPPDRRLARRWLAAAHAALRADGRLYLAGANDHGIRSVIADAEALFGNAVLVDYRRRHRCAYATKSAAQPHETGWLRTPGIAPATWHEFDVAVRGTQLHLRSLPGVFAYDRVDDGTALLLEHLVVPSGAHLLDVGCGHGVIGLVAARLGAARVDMVDANLLAVAAARENIVGNEITGARALPSDLLDAVAGERYDLIVTNPPFHVGKAVDYAVAQTLFRQARDALAPGGRLLLVANAFIRYDRLLHELFDSVEPLATTNRYRVLAASPPRRLAASVPRV